MTAKIEDIRTYHDAIYERYNPDEFVGREWLTEQATEFRDSRDGKIKVIVGEPGSGKSAFLAYLAEKWNCPRHFMRFDNSIGITGIAPRNFLISMGEQLHQKYGEKIFGEQGGGSTIVTVGFAKDKAEVVGRVIDAVYTLPFLKPMDRDVQVRVAYASGDSQVIGERVKRLVDVTEALSESELLHVMIINPLKRLEELQPDEIVVIFVDALDESLQHPGVKIPDVIPSTSDPDFPKNLRFIITSRKGDHLVRFENDILDIDDVEKGFKKHNEEDIKKYIDVRLNQTPLKHITQQWNDQARKTYINDLSEKSERNFLYLYHLFNELKERVANGETNISKIGMPDGLNEIYRDFAVNKIRNDISGSIHFSLTTEITRDMLSALQKISGVAQVRTVDRDIILNLNKDVVNTGVVIGPLIAVNLPMDATSLKIIQPGMGDDSWEKNYLPILGVLAVSYEALNRKQIADFARVEVTYVDRIISHLKQFLDETKDRTENRYRIFHLTFAEYLLDSKRNQEYPLDGPSYHYLIATTYRRTNENWTEVNWENVNDLYTYHHLIQHLDGAVRSDDLSILLLSFPWLQAKLENTDINETLRDYDLGLNAGIGRTDIPTYALQMVQGALRLSAHVLAQDKRQLAGQLLGRMLDFPQKEIQDLLEKAKLCQKGPWLRPIAQNFQAPGGPLIFTLAGHTDTVTEVVLTPDGKRAISASEDSTIKAWDLERGIELYTLTGNANAKIAVSSDGQRAVSASHDMRVWDLEKGAELYTLKGSTEKKIHRVVLTPDGKRAVTSTFESGIFKIWDLEQGVELHTLESTVLASKHFALTSDGKRVVTYGVFTQIWDLESGVELITIRGHNYVTPVALTVDGRWAASASESGTLTIWNLESGVDVNRLDGHTGAVTNLVFTPDNQRVVSASKDGTLKVWNLNSGTELHTLKGHTHEVTGLVLTLDGLWAVSASKDHTLKVWDLERGIELYTLAGSVDKIVLFSDGQRVLSAGAYNRIRIWNLKNGTELQTLVGEGVKLTRDGKRAISIFENTLKVWDLEKSTKANIQMGHNTFVNALAITLDGRRAVSDAFDESIKVWNLETCTELFELDENTDRTKREPNHIGGARNVAVTPDGKCAVTVTSNDTLTIWDIEKGAKLHTLHGHEGRVMDVLITHDGQCAISASSDKTLKIWSINSGEELKTLVGHSKSVNAVELILSGKVISASDDGSIKIWDLESAAELKTLLGHTDEEEIGDVLVTIDGHKAVSNSFYGTSPKIWDLEKGEMLHELVGHSDDVTGFAITPDGHRVVTASKDNTLRSWDAENGTELNKLVGHTREVILVTLTPDGRHVISASWDNTLKVWDLESGKCLTTHFTEIFITCCATAPDGRTIVAGTSRGQVYFLHLEGLD